MAYYHCEWCNHKFYRFNNSRYCNSRCRLFAKNVRETGSMIRPSLKTKVSK